jgi:hypothetical protein
MRIGADSTAIQVSVALAIPVVGAAWLVAVPGLMTTPNFLALVGLVAGIGWVAKRTYRDAQPASSLAQTLYDADRARSVDGRDDK